MAGCVARERFGQSGLEALNIGLLINFLCLDICFQESSVSTLIGPQFTGEKCIGGVVVVAVVHCRQVVVETVWVGCRGLARWGKASPCIVGGMWTHVVEHVGCLYRVSIDCSVQMLRLDVGLHFLFNMP